MTPAIRAVQQAGISYEVHEYDHDPSALSYGLEAAQKLGVEPGRIFKSLVVSVDGKLAMAVIPVERSLDLKALAAAVRGKRAVMAEVQAAERATGYVAGGISPLGQRRQLPTVIDESATAWGRILVSAGRRGMDLEVGSYDLIGLAKARVASIARQELL